MLSYVFFPFQTKNKAAAGEAGEGAGSERREGVVVEVELLERAEAGAIPAGSTVVLTVTGHGLKDPQWALKGPDGVDVQPTVVGVDTAEVASVLGLQRVSA